VLLVESLEVFYAHPRMVFLNEAIRWISRSGTEAFDRIRA
jgi:hypothetical protein